MNIDTIKATIRSKFNLKEDADVRVLQSRLEVKNVEENDPYAFTARITTDAVDRQDEVVLPAGGVFTDFLNSGIIAWNHDYGSPIGFPNKNKPIIRGDNFIECGGIFMKRPADWQGEFFPDFARAFVTQARTSGINAGVSIGFIPIESRKPTKADIERYGPEVQLVFSKWKLLEFSIAPVQANQEAVITAIGKGLMTRAVAKAVGYDIPEIARPAPVIKAPLPRKIIRESICLMEPSTAHVIDAAEISRQIRVIARDEMRKQLMKNFGKVYA